MSGHRQFERNAPLETALRALAADDARAQAPDRVEAAVMAAWDAQRPAPRRPPRMRAHRLWMAAAAAALVMTAYVGWRSDPVKPGAGRANGRAVHGASPRDSVGARDGLVLLPDPAFDVRSAAIVRVRMSGDALRSLGVVLPGSRAAGLVDVEMLVGEDGVARSIRRATPVAASKKQE